MSGGELRRIAFTLQYDGSAFFGWQLQPDRRSVQGEVERVLTRLFDRPTRVTGSGRTDRGVHATGQVAVADAPPKWEATDLRRAMNALAPRAVWVSHAAVVDADFHPRYDAVMRDYVYRVGIADIAASPFHAPWCWPLCRPLDLAAVREATRMIIGDHSFRSFAKAGQEERGDRCTVFTAEWETWADVGLEFRISANRFLHHMVRYLVGTIVDAGLRVRPTEDVAQLLRSPAGLVTSPPAPAHGLFLTRVRYPAGRYDEGPSGSSPLRALPLTSPQHTHGLG